MQNFVATSFALALGIFLVKAQFSKGELLLGTSFGSASYSSSESTSDYTDGNNRTNGITLNVGLHWFIESRGKS